MLLQNIMDFNDDFPQKLERKKKELTPRFH